MPLPPDTTALFTVNFKLTFTIYHQMNGFSLVGVLKLTLTDLTLLLTRV